MFTSKHELRNVNVNHNYSRYNWSIACYIFNYSLSVEIFYRAWISKKQLLKRNSLNKSGGA
jgi:hypothetical protein